jgi:hypothetical protein
MEVLDALLVEGTHVLFSSAPVALFFWFNLALLMVLAALLLPGRLRKARRRRQVERLFQASARASSGERRENELAAFARHVGRLAEDFGGRLKELRTDRI